MVSYNGTARGNNEAMGSDSTTETAPLLSADGNTVLEYGSIEQFHEDPFRLQSGILTDEELGRLRSRTKGKRIARHQDQQNRLIRSLLKPLHEHVEDARLEEEVVRLPVKIAIYASLYSNLALCVLQIYAASSSGSLSLLATAIDSVFDFGANALLWWLHRKAVALDVNKWPVGGARLETIGNIAYGFLMGTVNFIVVLESARTLMTKEGNDLEKFHLPSILAVTAALGVKFVLFSYCLSIRRNSSQVQVLWEDHRNDIFINGFGVAMSLGGSTFRWWLDATGAIFIASGVIIAWGRTIYHEFELLAGKSAPNDFLNLIIYKVATFSPDITHVDTVRAYHSGPDYFVEVDIVMNSDTPLSKAHDLSQELQDKLEALPRVERAFVHVDHETAHIPEHRKPPKSPI